MGREIPKSIFFGGPFYGGTEEASIRHSLQRIFCLMDITRVHKAHLDISGVYSGWDPMSQRMLGYEGKDVVGKLHIRKMFACIEDYEHVMRIVSNHRRFAGIVPFRRKDGYTVVVRLTIMKECDENGDLRGYLVTAVDRSDERKLEAQLENHLIILAGAH